jgi:NAD(P)-dependent dehydrogenase (short-subunit alcohol dehydrogenase family)
VLIADVQDAAAVIATAQERGYDMRFHRTDVSVATDVAALLRHALGELGGLDVLINAAGIGGGTAMTADYEEEEFDRVVAVNLKGVFLCMKYAIGAMLRGGGGAIVNVASVLGLVGMARTPAYSAAKGGVVQLTRVVALEYAAQHIRVNCICPGVIDTPMLRDVPAGRRELLVAQQPIGRLGTAEEIAAAAVFLASDASAFTTGAVWTVDGGFTAR